MLRSFEIFLKLTDFLMHERRIAAGERSTIQTVEFYLYISLLIRKGVSKYKNERRRRK